MLELLRKGAKTWVAKGFFIILLSSFAIWGANSSLFSSSSDSVLTVGGKSVSSNDFRLAFQRELSALSRQFNSPLSVEQAKLFGAGERALARLAAGAALDQLATNMNLGLSKDRLAKTIGDDPAFHDEAGVYQKALFYDRLRNANIRPDDYIRDSTRIAIRVQIVDATANGYQAPKVLTEALRQHANESRGVDYIALSNANIDPVKAPGDQVLTKWYEENKTRYKAPEYRKIAIVKLEPADIADISAISDAMVADDYEKHKDGYRTPEMRTIEQLTFSDQAQADSAKAKLASGTTFDQLVTEQGKTAADVLLGDFTKEQMPNAAMGEAAFGVPTDGSVSAVTQGPFGPVILRVTNIRPQTLKTLADVAVQLRQDLANSLATSEIQNVYDRLEDLRASGQSLEEAAKQLKLTSRVIDMVDDTGRNAQGAEIIDIPAGKKLLNEAFKTDPGIEAIPLSLGDSGYVWFETLAITPSRERKLDEVRVKLVTDWSAEQQKSALAKKAALLVDQIHKGAKISDLATELGLFVEKKSAIRRQMQDPVFSGAAVTAAFGGPMGHAAAAPGVDGEGQIVLQVTQINPLATSDALESSDARIEALAKASGDDILDQMMGALQGEYGVTTNRALADRAMVR